MEKEKISIGKISDLLKKSNDDGTFLDSLYDLYFFIGLTKGVNDMNNGNGITLDELDKEMEARHESALRRFG